MCTTSLSRKLCGKDDFKLQEVYKFARLLKISLDQIHVYFPDEFQPTNR